jgi:hypothetical protein
MREEHEKRKARNGVSRAKFFRLSRLEPLVDPLHR